MNIKMENNEKVTESELFCTLFPQGTRKPDSDQTAAIIKTDNAVVSAGAGSGKTEVLATRYAYLLMTNPFLRVKNILALTFTKKAAAEIYARVFKKLNEFYSRLSDEKYGDRFLGEGKPATLLKRAINELSEAKIQTLDSYSGDIVRLAASQYG
ncbi:MAG: UvrD-helicase domain-containing protein, partial [Treponemataceae bacterium]|nr:UvrD-helicase domain-containing protein [Treponemataceae bacterium]